jgi:hypothetical protein
MCPQKRIFIQTLVSVLVIKLSKTVTVATQLVSYSTINNNLEVMLQRVFQRQIYQLGLQQPQIRTSEPLISQFNTGTHLYRMS